MSESVYQQAQKLREETTTLRRWFHTYPEPSFKEYETVKYIREELRRLGIEFHEAGKTGTVGIIRGQSEHPIIALRADIDALEIQEKNEVPYRSVNEGLMHACGHDSHAAALLTAAKILVDSKENLNGTVKLIFQPAEEVGQGAASVIKTGLLDDVTAFFGIHVRAGLPAGKIALQAGPVMAGANSLEIDVWGESGHAGHPDQAVDAIAAGAEIVGALQSIVSREISPTDAAVISICQFHAGTRDNIIANHARISGTVRITSEEVRAQVSAAIHRVVEGVSAAYRVKSQVNCGYATPVLSNSSELYPVVVQAAQEIVKAEDIEGLIPKLGTEDFSAYASIAPVFFAFVGSGGEFPHHHERFDIDEEALSISAALHATVAIKYLEKRNRGFDMAQVESFQLDHTIVKAPYVRIAGVEYNAKGSTVQKYDLRFIQPNQGAIPTAALHTLEHFLSIFLRDEIEGVIDISPMGCRTGFYLVLWDEHEPEAIATALEKTLKQVLEQTEIPAATAKECGNYQDQSLELAKEYAKQVLNQGISRDPFERILPGRETE